MIVFLTNSLPLALGELMKQSVVNLILFFVFCIAFSACGGPQANNGSSPANSSKPGSQTSGAKPSDYPPVSSGIAEGIIHLLDGSKTKLSDHKGKVVILNLWGIWCGPCRDEMPHLAAMQRQYADKGLEVFGLNIGDQSGNAEPVENIKRFAETSNPKIDYTLARIESTMISQFYLLSKQQVVPQTILVDREGRLRGVFIGGGQNNYNKIQETLDKTMNE